VLFHRQDLLGYFVVVYGPIIVYFQDVDLKVYRFEIYCIILQIDKHHWHSAVLNIWFYPLVPLQALPQPLLQVAFPLAASARQTISFIEISIEAGILLGRKHEACFVLGVAGNKPMQS
jgi:hypothetical protein